MALNLTAKSLIMGYRTVLGPLMYLLYVNDIMDSNMISDLNMFADDTAIVAHGSVLTDVVAQITGDIKKLGDWLNYSKLAVKGNIRQISSCTWLFAKNTG